ncbi:hypothetical protein N4G58_08925 [Edwardsiella piscicida]|nr:hypothetical protein N4G58_08925 [Edwardsiella piscicida]
MEKIAASLTSDSACTCVPPQDQRLTIAPIEKAVRLRRRLYRQRVRLRQQVAGMGLNSAEVILAQLFIQREHRLLRIDGAPLNADAGAEVAVNGGEQKVRQRMVTHDGVAPRPVDLHDNAVAGLQIRRIGQAVDDPRLHGHQRYVDPLTLDIQLMPQLVLHIDHRARRPARGGDDRPNVAHLSPDSA